MSAQFYRRWTVVLLLLWIADQVSKELARHLGNHPGEGLFYLSYQSNPGLAFGLGAPAWIPLALTPLALIFIGYLIWQCYQHQRLGLLVGLGLVAIGGLGNLADRLRYGQAVDFFHLWSLPVFNLADLYLLAGLLTLWVAGNRRHHGR